MEQILAYLREQNLPESLIRDVKGFRAAYPVEERVQRRVGAPQMHFFGSDILQMAVAGILAGENILLCGPKATGKNILAENLAWIFGRPVYNVSFHVNTDSSTLIGTDTFRDNEVTLRKGPVYQCAAYGGFGILDEINMAKNDAVAVLHATLDYRRIIDVPGYEKIDLHPATRFIGTMNYGYAGTRELNEALASRFVILQMPSITQDNLTRLLLREFPGIKKQFAEQFSGLFSDIEKKCESGELTEKVLDLRGLLDALRLIQNGLSPYPALDMGLTNKTFDAYEQTLIRDIITTRISKKTESTTIFS